MSRSPAEPWLVLLLLAASCGVPEDDLEPKALKLTTFQATPLSPVAGERVYFRVEGEGMADLELHQGPAVVFKATNAPNVFAESFVAASAEPLELTARGFGGAEEKKLAAPYPETCLIDGVWRGRLTKRHIEGSEDCAVFPADDAFAETEAAVRLGGHSINVNVVGVGDGRRDRNLCTYFYVFRPEVVAWFTQENGTTTLTVRFGNDTCKRAFVGTVTRDP